MITVVFNQRYENLEIGSTRDYVIDQLGQPDNITKPGFYSVQTEELHYYDGLAGERVVVINKQGMVEDKYVLVSP